MAREQSNDETVRFLKGWQGHSKGSVCSSLGRGVMQTLVDNNVATWVTVATRRKRQKKVRQSDD